MKMNRLTKLIRFALVATGIVAFAADARAEYDARIVVDNTYTAEKPYVLETGKTYTAVPLTTVQNACGGAVEVQEGGHLIGTNITFCGNVCGGDHDGYGGAISSIGGTNVFYGTTKFINNYASESGGAIQCRDGFLMFEGDAVFEENSSEKAGVIAIRRPQVLIFNGDATFTKNTATEDLFSNTVPGPESGETKIEFNKKATFTENEAKTLIPKVGSLTFNDEAAFVGNKGRCVYHCTFNAHACFTNNSCNKANFDAACSINGINQMMTFAKGATFSGNTAPRNGAVYNMGKVFFSGLMDLATGTDIWYNQGTETKSGNTTVCWDLTGGLAQYGAIRNFQYYTNDVNNAQNLIQNLRVAADQERGEYTIASGDMTGWETDTTRKYGFTITNGTTGATAVIATGGGAVACGGEKFALSVRDNGTPGIATDDLLVLQVGPSTIVPTEVTGATAKVYTNGNVEVAAPYAVDPGAAFDVVYTADAGYMFPGGYRTFTTNLTADAATITVTLTADQQPVAAAPCTDCITFSGDAAFGIKMAKNGTPAEPKLECSQDQIFWSKFDLGNGAAAGADNKLYLRGTGNKKISKDNASCYAFTNTAGSAATAIACAGNTLTLLDYQMVSKGEEPTMGDYAFISLFNGFAALTTAPELPATNLTMQCYGSMFRNCTSLTTAPALPATKLANLCYSSMFFGCTALTDVPELPATTLEAQCYDNMFNGCTALEVNTNGAGKAWLIPSDAAVSAATAQIWNKDMFKGTTGNITNTAVAVGVTYYVLSALPPEPILARPAVVANADAAVYTNGHLSAETAAGSGSWHAWSNKTATVVYTAKAGYCFEDGTTEKTVSLDTRVNPAVLTEAPAAPGKATLQLGVVAQRYPWNGTVDVGYKTTYWPAGKKGAVEVTLGETVTTNEFAITGFGAITGTAAIPMPAGKKGAATFKAVVK